MLKWAASRPSQDQERGGADNRNEIQREEEHELEDLAKGERRVHGGGSWLSQHFHFVGCILIEKSGGGHEIDETFADEGCLQMTVGQRKQWEFCEGSGGI